MTQSTTLAYQSANSVHTSVSELHAENQEGHQIHPAESVVSYLFGRLVKSSPAAIMEALLLAGSLRIRYAALFAAESVG